ncbi:MAG: DNA glycosylase [Candidatus Bathyarchaeia archaeon]|jgi:A/G-specific adenine glycosylase
MPIKKEMSDLLIKWYKKNCRQYPWRENTDPYRVLIAEIMLQRTKADQVVPTYLSFLERFPNFQKLNSASEEDLTKFFYRLGLVHRSKYVKMLATDVILRFNGKIPENRNELLSLPAVGEYVADAVLCFAFNKPSSIVDSNVCRVIGRVFDLTAKGEARRDPKFRKKADELLPETKVNEYNWAVIDLAALICIPKKPLHSICPLRKICASVKKRDIV